MFKVFSMENLPLTCYSKYGKYFYKLARSTIVSSNPNPGGQQPNKDPILGQSHGLSDEEGQMIQQMIREESHSARELYIPKQDLSQEATTHMSPEAAQVIADSKVRAILQMFNRDYVYGQGRFDEYRDGLIFKWGDGYSRKHI